MARSLGSFGRRWTPLLAAALLCACSLPYAYHSAAGHVGLLARRRSMVKLLDDPRTPEPLKEKLRLASDVRDFAFGAMGLERSRDYSTVSEVGGDRVTTIVVASRRTSFEPYLWSFPFIGRFPYKGYFKQAAARREARGLERRGYDVYLGGVAAYNTPLWLSDPLPSPVLDYPPGELAALLIHELTHGTVSFKDHTGFNEALATFVGNQGAEDFLALRFGPDSKDLAGFRARLERDGLLAGVLGELHSELDVLYRSAAGEKEKLERREEVFARGRARLKSMGLELGPALNNAFILANRLYCEDLSRFEAVYEAAGKDWPATIEVFRSLDPKRPAEDLEARIKPMRSP
ncbi:MAG: aminopeptidase [Elusimicrobiota bacterium]